MYLEKARLFLERKEKKKKKPPLVILKSTLLEDVLLHTQDHVAE